MAQLKDIKKSNHFISVGSVSRQRFEQLVHGEDCARPRSHGQRHDDNQSFPQRQPGLNFND